MELKPITDKLVQNLQRAQVESVVAVTKALGLKTGSQFLAEVSQVTQATPEERAQLIKAIEDNLRQLNQTSSAPAIKALVNQLMEQRNLAETPGVKLVNLTLTPPASPSASQMTPMPVALLSYTNLPVQPGQTLLMQLSESQRLQVLQILAKTDATLTFSPSLTSITSTTSAADPQHPTGNQAVNPKPTISPAALEAMSETLRRLLPQKDQGQDLMTALPRITQFIQQLPVAERKEWLSSQLQQSLKTLANQVRMADQLTSPKMVEMALKNNGQSFENKLAQLLTKNPGNPAQSTTSGAATSTNLSSSNSGLHASIQTQQNLFAQNAVSQNLNNRNPIERMVNQDMKGALLGILHQLDSELEPFTPLPTSFTATNEPHTTQLANALPQLLGMLMQKQQPGELSQKQLRNQLVMLMHQYTLGSLAKIQLQQLHRINHQINQANEVAQPTQSWQFEIPVRTGQDITPVHIHLEQQWVEEQTDEDNPTATRLRQWNLMMGFNLPVIGQFYAQLTLLNEQLSAKFWAEDETTLIAAKNKMDGLKTQLENRGIQVMQMQCVPGLPPKPKLSFSYSLVDIKT